MTEASRVQKMLIDQNNEINRLRNRIEKLEAALREITVSARLVGDYYHVKIAREALEGKDD